MTVGNERHVLDKGGLATLVEQVKHMLNEEIGELTKFETFDFRDVTNKAELPNIGSAKTIYIVSTDVGDIMYRWDDVELRYRTIGTDYNNIEIIRGGTASNE